MLKEVITMGGLNVKDQIEGIIVVGDLVAKATEVEVVLNVLVVNLTKELVTS